MVLQYYSDRLRCRLTMDDEFLIEELEDGQWKPVALALKKLAARVA